MSLILELQTNWLEKLLCDELAPKWLKHAPAVDGLFLPSLDRHWQPQGPALATVVSQSRLIYLFSESYSHCANPAYKKAALDGTDALIREFIDPRYGGFVWSVSSNNKVEDPKKRLYGQAFAVFALVHAYRLDGKEAYKKHALETLRLIYDRFKDSVGGLQPKLEQDFSGESSYRSQNPVMHLIEAELALAEHCGEDSALNRAQTLIDFLFEPALKRGDPAIPEFYDPKWQPLKESPRESSEPGWVSPGHQFELAYLISKAIELGLPESYLDYARFALNAGVRYGPDPVYGGIVRSIGSNGKVLDDRKVFWLQTEAIRCLARFCCLHGHSEHQALLKQTLNFFHQNLYDHEEGGVFIEVQRDGSPMTPDKGSVWKVDYHTTAMIAELLSLKD